MRTSNTAPVAITDKNGKATTVHRRTNNTAVPHSSIPRVAMQTASTMDEADDLKAVILQKISDFDRRIRADWRVMTHSIDDVEMLRVLDRFCSDNVMAVSIVEACTLLLDLGETPAEYLQQEHIDSLALLRDPLMKWEMLHDNYKGGDIDRRSPEREALILHALEEPSRTAGIVEALERGASSLIEVMEIEKEFSAFPRSISHGML